MDRSERKAAVSAYKERKPIAGVYAIRCAATGEQWVGSAPIFPQSGPADRCATARHRAEPGASVRLERSRPKSFTFKILEEIDLEQLNYGRERAQGAGRALARGFRRRGRGLTFPPHRVRAPHLDQ
jgi:hypothetical protein